MYFKTGILFSYFILSCSGLLSSDKLSDLRRFTQEDVEKLCMPRRDCLSRHFWFCPTRPTYYPMMEMEAFCVNLEAFFCQGSTYVRLRNPFPLFNSEGQNVSNNSEKAFFSFGRQLKELCDAVKTQIIGHGTEAMVRYSNLSSWLEKVEAGKRIVTQYISAYPCSSVTYSHRHWRYRACQSLVRFEHVLSLFPRHLENYYFEETRIDSLKETDDGFWDDLPCATTRFRQWVRCNFNYCLNNSCYDV